MSPGAASGSQEGSSTIARVAGAGALLAALALVVILLFGSGNGGHTYHLLFETGGQLVRGNEVLVAGQHVGSVEDIELTGDWQAEVTISMDEPLHEGTEAVIRSTSLSGIANRYVAITQGPDSAPVLEDGALITGERTTTPVDLDQLFNALNPQARRGLQKVIQGFATVYGGAGEDANESYRYLNPGLSSTQRLLAEITRDQRVLTDFLVDGSKVVTAIASRRDDLSSLVGNANAALGAIAEQNEALDRSLVALPPALRQASTTFVNLRAALDDLDPLVATSKEATRDLAPFLRDLRPVARRAVPVFKDLRLVVVRRGRANDLTDMLRDLPRVRRKASSAFPASIEALNASQETIEFARPYIPDVLAWLTKFGEVTAYYDANGHYARVQPANSDLFAYDEAADPAPNTGVLDPIPPSQQFQFFQTTPNALGPFVRCPGGATQKNSGWPAPEDHPFLDDGSLGPDDCDPDDVPLGPLP